MTSSDERDLLRTEDGEDVQQRTDLWIRLCLLAVAALAGLSYGWSMNHDLIDAYYAAAVRSMAGSWHDFMFGAFDPAGTITLDKLPGAFWIQALSVRLFGLHTWAIVLPQTLEGIATVLFLYRAVRRLAGPIAGLVAALVLAASPAIVTLDRGNISDSLMILLLVIAADAASAAIVSGRLVFLLLAGLFVGLAFQAKMIEAWLALPAMGLAFLLAAPGGLWRRVCSVVLLGLVAGAVSLLWMTAVTVVPASGRPYVDGSYHDSVFEQVFDYNGFGRFGKQTPMQLLANEQVGVTIPYPQASWNRLLTGSPGRDGGWLLPTSLVAAALGLISRRSRSRRDKVRAAIVLWGTWLLTFFVVLSLGSDVNPYYISVLSPAAAALIGTVVPIFWAARMKAGSWLILSATVAASTSYAVWLLPSGGTGEPGWLRPAVVIFGAAVSLTALLTSMVVRGFPQSIRVVSGRMRFRTTGLGVAVVCAALAVTLAVPAVASASVVARGESMYDTPFESPETYGGIQDLFVQTLKTSKDALPELERVRLGARYLLATQTSTVAAGFTYAGGQEVLPIGGFTGTIPEPTLAQLKSDVALGWFHLVIAGRSDDRRIEWIAAHCPLVSHPTYTLNAYFCTPGDVR